mgnify:CR=1 FL=1
MLAVTIGGTGVTAFANNNSDTYECFSFSGENTLRSDFRRKDDTSSSWCNCYDSSNSDSGFYIQVYGTSEHNNTSGSYCGRRSYYFSEDTTWYMWNVVYETYGDCDYTAAYLIASPQVLFMMILSAGGVRTMAQVLPEMNNDRRRQFMKKRSIGILLLGLVVCTCISGCSSQSIADVNEKSIQAEEETETKDEKRML